MSSLVLKELKHHGPFTLLGALGSVALIMLLRRFAPDFLTTDRAADWFEFTHPMHVVLSAMVTATIFRNYKAKSKHSQVRWVAVIAVGYVGSIGIATLSDCLIPYWGEILLGMDHAHAHIGIIEMPYIINFAALFGIGFAYWQPKTYFPHAGHVLLSMAASLFHILRAQAGSFSLFEGISITLFLFVAVWIPCCLSDIVFPLLFIKKEDLPDDLHIH
ncbi:MAG: hypothetical protein ISR85_07170 [Kiritimatiellales bacterium]|nr:hypothetical protein [Kiritimatiellota bacterium]MBL7012687.1 hypothetical protein [Kiritimatiellales bacterium]